MLRDSAAPDPTVPGRNPGSSPGDPRAALDPAPEALGKAPKPLRIDGLWGWGLSRVNCRGGLGVVPGAWSWCWEQGSKWLKLEFPIRGCAHACAWCDIGV